MPHNISYKRGVVKKIHPKTGVGVYMYKDTPGVYLNAFGTEVSEELAAEAGFDVKNLGLARLKRERMAQAMQAIELELALSEEKRKVIKDKDGWKVVQVNDLGGHVVEDPEGNVLSMQIPKEQAVALLEKLVPSKPSAREKAQKKAETE